MKNKITNTHRNFLMLCPIPVLLFFTLVFWSMVGGHKSTTSSGGRFEKFNHQPSPANTNRINSMEMHSYHQKANNVKSVIRNTQNADEVIYKLDKASSISLKPVPERNIRRVSTKVSTGNITINK